MILFVAAEDTATKSNLPIAEKIYTANDILLFAEKATKQNLLNIFAEEFEKNDRTPLLVMSHGTNQSFEDNNSQKVFETKADILLLNKRHSFIYACHTANDTGKTVQDKLSSESFYWAYTGAITPPPILDGNTEDVLNQKLAVFIPIFQNIKDCFSYVKSSDEIILFLNDLKEQCETAEIKFYEMGLINEMDLFKSLYQLWSRLRVFQGNNLLEIKHIEAEEGSIF